MTEDRCLVHTQLLYDRLEDPAAAHEPGEGRDCPLARSLSAWLGGDVRGGLELAALAAEPAHRGCHPDCAWFARIWHAQLLIRIRDVPAAGYILDGIHIPAGIGEGDGVSVALLAARAELALAAGDLGSAVAKAELGVRLVQRVGAPLSLPNLHAVLAVGAVRRSDIAVGLQYARLLGDDALLGWTIYLRGQCAWAVAQAVEADQGPHGAAHLVERLIADPCLSRELLVAQPAAAAWLVRVARALDEEGLALHCARQAAALARQAGWFPALHAAALHAEGLYEQDPDKLRAAADRQPDRWASASANEDLAKTWSVARLGRDRAIEPLKCAAAGYEGVGAARDYARVASRLRDLGVRSGRVMRPMRRNGHSIGFLTDTEFAVANLVSRGLTNVQVGHELYISAHTVAFHLKKIFRKMEVSSRVELACVWANITSDQLDAG
jgi:DNA-binding CsgD family transcriptional regulator